MSYNTDHPDHLIQLGSISGFATDNEPEGEEALDVPSPQLWDDPHFEKEEAAGAPSGATGVDEEEEEEDKASDDEDNDDAGVGHVISSESSDSRSE